ncbi:hypothetical protein NMG60_11016505 [Bertholletia excelsa]
MASQFDRWEKDPFFSAAEEVQESADRMGWTYRTWIHSTRDSSGLWNPEELRRDLHTAIDTTKWQLEEFERAVRSSYSNSLAGDAKERHHEFITAVGYQISEIESSLHELSIADGKPPALWLQLDEGDRDELALFLSGQSVRVNEAANIDVKSELLANFLETKRPSTDAFSKNSQLNLLGAREDKLPGPHRTASASADIGSWKIAVTDEVFPQSSSKGHMGTSPQKILSFSGVLNTMEMVSKLKWPKKGNMKLKNLDHYQESESTFQSQQLNKGISSCYERGKGCLDGPSSFDDCYDKQLYGWHGAIRRLLQRSIYQMQYRRPVQMVFSIVLGLIVLFAVLAI